MFSATISFFSFIVLQPFLFDKVVKAIIKGSSLLQKADISCSAFSLWKILDSRNKSANANSE